MKKIITLIVTCIMGLTFLTGCGDAVADEFEQFMNTDMIEVNANYAELTVEVAKWSGFTDNAQLVTSISEVLIPNIEESLDMLSKIELTTDEVKAIKGKYEDMLEKYKECFEAMLIASKNNDEAALAQATTLMSEAIVILEEYNSALEALAEEKGMTVEY